MNSTRSLPHQCPACGRLWALRVIDLPSGQVVACRYCATVRATHRTLKGATSA